MAVKNSEKAVRGLDRIRGLYHTHWDFVLLLALFSVLQLMISIFFAPGGRFGDYSDYSTHGLNPLYPNFP